MKANPHLVLTLAACLLLPMLQAEESKYPPINPALLYWQAAAQLPKLSDPQAAELRDMAAGKMPVDAAKIESLGFGSAERLFRKAAASPAPCDWGLVREDGPEMLMPHLSKVREMANIAVAQGEALLAQGKTTEGLEWFLTAHRIARHSGTGGTLVSYLVQASIEAITLQAEARHCLGWDEATRHGYAGKLQALPPLHSLQEAYQGELLFADWFDRIGGLSEAERREKLEKMFAETSADGKAGAEQKERMDKLHTLVDPAVLRKELAAFRDFHRRIEAAFGKPWKEAEPELVTIEGDVRRSDFFLVKEAFPAFGNIHDRAAGLATRRIMLDVALQYGAQIDEARAAAAHDAFGGQPLRLKKADDGTLSLMAAEEHPKGKVIELKLGK